MDIMKVNSMFMKRILSKMINHSIKKKTGIDADIKLGDIYISYDEEDGQTNQYVSVSIAGKISKIALEQLVSKF